MKYFCVKHDSVKNMVHFMEKRKPSGLSENNYQTWYVVNLLFCTDISVIMSKEKDDFTFVF